MDGVNFTMDDIQKPANGNNLSDHTPKWLKWASDIQAIAQSGITFGENPFDIQRYKALNEIAAQILAEHSQLSDSKILDLFLTEKGYATPKIDVRGAVFQDNQILMVKERMDGLWSLPGGYADVNLSAATCVCKEIDEESGFRTIPKKLIMFYDKLKHEHPPQLPHTYKCFFLCELQGGTAKPSIETSDVGFFSKEQIPPLSLPRVTINQISRCFEHFENPDLPTDFD